MADGNSGGRESRGFRRVTSRPRQTGAAFSVWRLLLLHMAWNVLYIAFTVLYVALTVLYVARIWR